MSVHEELPVRQLNGSYDNLSDEQLRAHNEPSGKPAVGADEFLRRNTLNLGVSKSERLAGLSKNEGNRPSAAQLQKPHRTFNPSLNANSESGAKTELQLGYERMRRNASGRGLHRHFSKREELKTNAFFGHTLDADRLPGDPALTAEPSEKSQPTPIQQLQTKVQEKVHEVQSALGEVRERVAETVNRLIGSGDRREAHQ
jgi:hypothetical protein